MKYTLQTHRPRAAPLNFDRDLNLEQQSVVQANPSPLLVLAGAGTGKTRTLIYRVARLVAAGCPPERMMLVTFTNRAAREMVQRVEDLLQTSMRSSSAGTFHRVGHRLLRRYGEAIGLSPDFGILDPEDARDLLSTAVNEETLTSLTSKRFPAPKVLASMISLSVGTMRPLADVIDQHHPRFREQRERIGAVALRYRQIKARMNVRDFDDLLALWHHILTDPEHSSLAAKIRQSYDHIFVDEYQDINHLQGSIVDHMAADHRSLTCVGDDAQSIYSFRGADFSQIFRFQDRHPDAKIMRLTTNYRSCPEILQLANASIRHNQDQHPKELKAHREAGEKPALIPLRDVYQQAELVAQRVLELHYEHNLPLRKMSVLYRNHAHSLELQVELTRRKIPYSIRSGMRFFEQAHIKDVLAFLKAQSNPKDSLAWLRLLRLNAGVGQQTAQKIAEQLANPPTESSDTLSGDLQLRIAELAKESKGRAANSLASLASLWTKLEQGENREPGQAIRLILATSYDDYLERNFANAEQRREDLLNLAAFASRFESSHEFLDELALLEGISAEQIKKNKTPEDKLVLSTIHQAKGLEWPVCFVIWLGEGRFPSAMALRNRSELEEERRLFYVATTRAADELYLCYPTVEDGERGAKFIRPSRFVSELDDTLLERWEIEETPK